MAPLSAVLLAITIILWAAFIASLIVKAPAGDWFKKPWGWLVQRFTALHAATLGKVRRRWRVEVKLEGQWFEKRFWTRLGAWDFQRLVRRTFDSYTIATYKEARNAKPSV